LNRNPARLVKNIARERKKEKKEKKRKREREREGGEDRRNKKISI